jgi:hypothetical protein
MPRRLSFEELEDLVHGWLTSTNQRCTPGATFNSCSTIAPHLVDWLKWRGVPAERLKVVGLLVPLGPRAHKHWRALEARGQAPYFTHHAAFVNDVVIDPAGAQFGTTFPLFMAADRYLALWSEAYILDWVGEGRETRLEVVRTLK